MNIAGVKMTSPCPVVDLAGWIGAYPFRGIPSSTIDDLRAMAAELNLQRVIVSPYEAIFWQNNLEAWQQAADTLADDDLLEVWPVVNPALPGQLARLTELLERYQPRGLRLLPNYHKYHLWDADVTELMDLARTRGMIVQVFECIADERWHWMLHVPPVPRLELEYLTSRFQDQPIVLSGTAGIAGWQERLQQCPQLFVDTARLRGPVFAVEQLVRQTDFPIGQVVFGSLWPHQIMQATLWQITSAVIDEPIRRQLLHTNAERLLNMASPAASQAEAS